MHVDSRKQEKLKKCKSADVSKYLVQFEDNELHEEKTV